MKKLYKLLPLLLVPVAFIFLAPSSGSPGGKSGSMGDGGANCTQCHSGTPMNASDWITSDVPGNGYIGGETYMFTATGTHSGVGKFGFELTAEDQSGNKVGSFTITNATETKLTGGNSAITHTGQGNTPTGDTKTWEFEWTAPDDVPGDITFYAAFNAANGNGSTSGDVIYLSELTYGPDVTGFAELEDDFRFYPNPSTGLVNLEVSSLENAALVNVYNQTGQRVQQVNLNSNYAQLDLSNQAKGVYFVQIGNDKMQKLIIK
jgi:hypothetical protein